MFTMLPVYMGWLCLEEFGGFPLQRCSGPGGALGSVRRETLLIPRQAATMCIAIAEGASRQLRGHRKWQMCIGDRVLGWSERPIDILRVRFPGCCHFCFLAIFEVLGAFGRPVWAPKPCLGPLHFLRKISAQVAFKILEL